ncbi:MAG: hypothetical protein CND86_03835 [Bacteroidetes bacterium MED-G21]|nr:MAG: hypothetical protein CND86_03835 [Bacteroidetes bacterium MED-G21]
MAFFYRFVFKLFFKITITMKRILGLILAFTFSISLYASDCEAPISKERFDSLLKTLELKNNDHQKYILISAYSNRECMSVNQLLSFIDLIDEHKVKVSIVQELCNSVFDKENIDQLMTNFTEYEKSVILKSVK